MNLEARSLGQSCLGLPTWPQLRIYRTGLVYGVGTMTVSPKLGG